MASGVAAPKYPDDDPDSPESKLENLLPEGYRSIILMARENGGLHGKVRLPIATKEEALVWVRKFELKNFCSYRSQKLWSFDAELKLHQNKFICSHRIPDEPDDGHYNCNSSIVFTMREVSPAPDFPSQATVHFDHRDRDRQKPRPYSELRVSFSAYFAKGHSPFSALVCHKCDIHSKYGPAFYDIVPKGGMCPSYKWCLREFRHLFSGDFRASTDEQLRVKLEDRIGKYNKGFASPCAGITRDSLIICTPLMKSVFHSGFGEDLITVRTFCSSQLALKRQKTVLFLCHTPIGSFPFGIIVTTSNNPEDVSRAVECLLGMLSSPSYKPVTVIVDENALISACLRQTFPESQLIFNEFQMLQSIWRIIRLVCQSDNEEFQALYEIFFQTLNSASEEDFRRNLDILMVYAEKHKKLASFLKYFRHRSDAYVLYAKPKVDFNTDVLNYTDSGTMLLQDVTVKYSQYFDILQLFDFVTNNYMDHYERKLRNIINGDLKGFFKTNFYVPLTRLNDFSVQKITDTEFLVCLNEFKFFVNAELDTCTCQVGVQGGSCVHQYIVEKTLGLLPECYTPIEEYMANIFQSILTHKDGLNAPEEDSTVSLEELEELESTPGEFEAPPVVDEDELLNDQEHFSRESGELRPSDGPSEVINLPRKIVEERVFSPVDEFIGNKAPRRPEKDDFDKLFVDDKRAEHPELPPLESAEETCETAIFHENNISESFINDAPLEEIFPPEDVSLDLSEPTYGQPMMDEEESYVPEAAGMSFIKNAPMQEILPEVTEELFENEAAIVEIAPEHDLMEEIIEETGDDMIQDGTVDSQTGDVRLRYEECLADDGPIVYSYITEDGQELLLTEGDEKTGVAEFLTKPGEEVHEPQEMVEEFSEYKVMEDGLLTEINTLADSFDDTNLVMVSPTEVLEEEEVEVQKKRESKINVLSTVVIKPPLDLISPRKTRPIDNAPVNIDEDAYEIEISQGDPENLIELGSPKKGPESFKVVSPKKLSKSPFKITQSPEDFKNLVRQMSRKKMREVSIVPRKARQRFPPSPLKISKSGGKVAAAVNVRPPVTVPEEVTIQRVPKHRNAKVTSVSLREFLSKTNNAMRKVMPSKVDSVRPKKNIIDQPRPGKNVNRHLPVKISRLPPQFKKEMHLLQPKPEINQPQLQPRKEINRPQPESKKEMDRPQSEFEKETTRSQPNNEKNLPQPNKEVNQSKPDKRAINQSRPDEDPFTDDRDDDNDEERYLNRVRSNHYKICGLDCDQYHSELEEFSDDSHFDEYDFEEDILSDCDSIVEQEIYDEDKGAGVEQKRDETGEIYEEEEVVIPAREHFITARKKDERVEDYEEEEPGVPTESLLKKKRPNIDQKVDEGTRIYEEEEFFASTMGLPKKKQKNPHVPAGPYGTTKNVPKKNPSIGRTRGKRTRIDEEQELRISPRRNPNIVRKRTKTFKGNDFHVGLLKKNIIIEPKRDEVHHREEAPHVPAKNLQKKKANVEQQRRAGKPDKKAEVYEEEKKRRPKKKRNIEQMKHLNIETGKQNASLPQSDKRPQKDASATRSSETKDEMDGIQAMLSGMEEPTVKNDELSFLLDDPRFEMVVDQQPADASKSVENPIEYVNEEEPSSSKDDLSDLLKDLGAKVEPKPAEPKIVVKNTKIVKKGLKKIEPKKPKKAGERLIKVSEIIEKFSRERSVREAPPPLRMILPSTQTPRPPNVIPAVLNGQSCVLKQPGTDSPYTIYALLQNANALGATSAKMICPIVLSPNNISLLTYQPYGVNANAIADASGKPPLVMKNGTATEIGVSPTGEARSKMMKIESTPTTVTRSKSLSPMKGDKKLKRRKQEFGPLINENFSFEEPPPDLSTVSDQEPPSRVTRSGTKPVIEYRKRARRSSSVVNEGSVNKKLFKGEAALSVNNRKRRGSNSTAPEGPQKKKLKKLELSPSVSPIDFESTITASVVEKSDATPSSGKYEDAFKRFLESGDYPRPPTIKSLSDTEDAAKSRRGKSKKRTGSLGRRAPAKKSHVRRSVSWSEELDVLEFVTPTDNDSDDSAIITVPKKPAKVAAEAPSATTKGTPGTSVQPKRGRGRPRTRERLNPEAPKRARGRPKGSPNKRKRRYELIILLERDEQIEWMCVQRLKEMKKGRKGTPPGLGRRRSKGYLELLEVARQQKRF